ncbi:YadA C-terminal domain-containing protein [Vibrio crassostreae]|uniref:YadA C-terminal domain-containing protein n=1 Tax=Vibrio crassostreae TaxID=246167 RepID=UPI002FE42022
MKKSIIAVSLATVFSLPAFAEVDVQNPIWNEQPSNPIEQVPTQPQLPVQPVLPTPSQPIEQVPSNPIEIPNPTQPIEQVPSQPDMDNSPERPQPPTPTQPPVDNSPERPSPDYGDTPDISGPTEAERSSALEMSQAELQSSFEAMATEYNAKFNDHAEQMDGIRASLHAVTNARPFVTNGEFAIGAGVGFAGSKEALALGGAYGINEQLSVSGTFHYETSGKYSSSDVAGGVGFQYNFK